MNVWCVTGKLAKQAGISISRRHIQGSKIAKGRQIVKCSSGIPGSVKHSFTVRNWRTYRKIQIFCFPH